MNQEKLIFLNSTTGENPIKPQLTRNVPFKNLYISGYIFADVPTVAGVPVNPVVMLKWEGLNPEWNILSNKFCPSYPLQISGNYTKEILNPPIKLAKNGVIRADNSITIVGIDGEIIDFGQIYLWLNYD